MHGLDAVSSLFLQVMAATAWRGADGVLGQAWQTMLFGFVSKVLLKHRHAHWVCVIHCCIHVRLAEMNRCIKAGWPTKAKVLLCGPLQKKFANYCCRGRILFPFQLALGS